MAKMSDSEKQELEALKTELGYYLTRGDSARAAQVRKQIALREPKGRGKGDAVETADAGPPENTAARTGKGRKSTRRGRTG